MVPHTGYAGQDFVRVLARVVLAPHADDPVERADRFEYRRGWRNFLTAEALDVEVTVEWRGRDTSPAPTAPATSTSGCPTRASRRAGPTSR